MPAEELPKPFESPSADARKTFRKQALAFLTGGEATLDHLSVLTNPDEAARQAAMRDLLDAARAGGNAAFAKERKRLEWIQTLRRDMLEALPEAEREKRAQSLLKRFHAFAEDLRAKEPARTALDVFKATGLAAHEYFDGKLLVDPSAYLVRRAGNDVVLQPHYAAKVLNLADEEKSALAEFLKRNDYQVEPGRLAADVRAATEAHANAKAALDAVKRGGESYEGEQANLEAEVRDAEAKLKPLSKLETRVTQLKKLLSENPSLRVTHAPLTDPARYDLYLVDLGRSLFSGAHVQLEPFANAASAHGPRRGMNVVSLTAEKQASTLGAFVAKRLGGGDAFHVLDFKPVTWHEKPAAVHTMNKGKFYFMPGKAEEGKPAHAFALYLKGPAKPEHVTPESQAAYARMVKGLGGDVKDRASLEYVHQKVPHPREGFEVFAAVPLVLAHHYAKRGRLAPK